MKTRIEPGFEDYSKSGNIRSDRHRDRYKPREVRKQITQAFVAPTLAERIATQAYVLTKEQIEMREITRSALTVAQEVDLTLYDPRQKFERPKEETPEELPELLKEKGFIMPVKSTISCLK